MSIVAIIPARGDSKGLPKKNLRSLAGKPMVAWTIEAALDAHEIDNVFVTTENKDIAGVSEGVGAVVLDRPTCLAGDTSQMSEVCHFALRQITENLGIFPDIVCVLTPTCPLRNSADIDEAIHLYQKYGRGSVLAGSIDHRFHWQTFGTSIEDEYEPCEKMPPQNRQGRQHYSDTDWLVEESGAIYVVGARDFLVERDFRLYPFHIYLMPKYRCLDIDSEEGLLEAQIRLQGNHFEPPNQQIIYDNNEFIRTRTFLSK